MANPTTGPVTYRDYFANKANDPTNGNFSVVDRLYRTENNNLDEDELLNRAITSDQDYPAGYIFLCQRGDRPCHRSAPFGRPFPRSTRGRNNLGQSGFRLDR